MDIFLLLTSNLFPLYILIAAGYVAGRYMEVNLESMAKMLIYFLMPFVIFGAVSKIDLKPEYLVLPLIMASLSVVMTLSSYYVSGKMFSPQRASMIAMSSASGNTGYFGIPIILALLSPEALGVYLMMNLGLQMSEASLVYFIGARGHHTVMDSIKRVARLPALYALLAGVMVNLIGIDPGQVFYSYWDHATGAWILMGMMMIGIALGKSAPLVFNHKMNTYLSVVKFIIWPVLMLGVIIADQNLLHLFTPDIHLMLFVMGIVPLPGNVVAYAAELKIHPEEAAMAVLVSTIFALLYIPLVFFILPFP